MSTIVTRRAVLAGASAITATAVLSACAETSDPDAELLGLVPRFPALNDLACATQEHAESILFEIRAARWFPARIAVSGYRTMPRERG